MTITVVGLLVAACQAPLSTTGVVSDDRMELSVGNYTDRVIELVVNGQPIVELLEFSERKLVAGELPPLPWHAEVRLATGRKLLELTVRSGSVERYENGGKGVGTRVDLSCGRIDIWSGYPLLGPVPGPGSPGDCDP